MNATFYGKKGFIDVNKLTILKWGDYPGLYRCHHKRTGRVQKEGNVIMEAEGER